MNLMSLIKENMKSLFNVELKAETPAELDHELQVLKDEKLKAEAAASAVAVADVDAKADKVIQEEEAVETAEAVTAVAKSEVEGETTVDVERLQVDLELMEDRNKGLEEENNTLTAKVADLEGRVKVAEPRVDELTAELAEVRNQLEEANGKISDLSRQVALSRGGAVVTKIESELPGIALEEKDPDQAVGGVKVVQAAAGGSERLFPSIKIAR